MSIQLKPTSDRIIVKPLKPKETSSGGIVLPEPVQEKNKGTVVACGPGRMKEDGGLLPIFVNVGDVVYYSQYGAGEPYKEDDVDYLILRQADVIGILDRIP